MPGPTGEGVLKWGNWSCALSSGARLLVPAGSHERVISLRLGAALQEATSWRDVRASAEA